MIRTIDKILETISKTKATNVCKINISKNSSIADYFVLATATSSVAVCAIADFLEEELKKDNIFLLRRNGKSGETWVVLDYGDVICHFFDEYTREFYNLEKLWNLGDNIEQID